MDAGVVVTNGCLIDANIRNIRTNLYNVTSIDAKWKYVDFYIHIQWYNDQTLASEVLQSIIFSSNDAAITTDTIHTNKSTFVPLYRQFYCNNELLNAAQHSTAQHSTAQHNNSKYVKKIPWFGNAIKVRRTMDSLQKVFCVHTAEWMIHRKTVDRRTKNTLNHWRQGNAFRIYH